MTTDPQDRAESAELDQESTTPGTTTPGTGPERGSDSGEQTQRIPAAPPEPTRPLVQHDRAEHDPADIDRVGNDRGQHGPRGGFVPEAGSPGSAATAEASS
ncbi:hypothetical protein, partial [Actinocorallia glomerata]